MPGMLQATKPEVKLRQEVFFATFAIFAVKFAFVATAAKFPTAKNAK